MDPRRSNNYITLAFDTYTSGDLEKAASFFEKALTFYNTEEKYIMVYYNLAQVYDELDENEKSIAFYDRIIEIKSEAQAFYGKAILYEKIKEYELAEENFRVAIELDVDFRDAHFFLANLFDIQGDVQKAIEEYSHFIEKFPEDYMGYNNLGSIYEENGEYEKALVYLKKSVELREDYFLSHFNLAVVYGRLGEIEESIASYERSKELNPDYSNIYLNLSALYLGISDLEKSEKILREGIEHIPDAPNLYYNLGCTMIKLSKKDQGINYLKEAIRLNPDLYHYGKNDPDLQDIDFYREFGEIIR